MRAPRPRPEQLREDLDSGVRRSREGQPGLKRAWRARRSRPPAGLLPARQDQAVRLQREQDCSATRSGCRRTRSSRTRRVRPAFVHERVPAGRGHLTPAHDHDRPRPPAGLHAQVLAGARDALRAARAAARRRGVRRHQPDRVPAARSRRAVARSPLLVLFRAPRTAAARGTGPAALRSRLLFDAWAHEASPSRPPTSACTAGRCARGCTPRRHGRARREFLDANAQFSEELVAELRERGPLARPRPGERSAEPWRPRLVGRTRSSRVRRSGACCTCC